MKISAKNTLKEKDLRMGNFVPIVEHSANSIESSLDINVHPVEKPFQSDMEQYSADPIFL